MKRYLLTLLLAIVSAGALTACGGGEIDDDPDLRCVIDGIPRKPEACL